MEIKRENTVVCDVYLKDNSYTVEEIMGEHTLTLNFLSRNVVELQINDYIDFEGTKYKIRHNEKVTKRETSLGWEYTVQFYSSRYDLLDVEFFLHGIPERKKNFDYYTGTARDWLSLFVKNMNRIGSDWVAGSCIESRMITLSFKDKKVGAVLDELIKELDTEYWISGQTMNIGKREYSSGGLVLAQGEGMGFTELEVSAVDDAPPVTVLYPYGSDKNLGPDYGTDYLLLPGGRLSIEKNVEKYGRIEKSMQFDHIYPKGEFAVTEKIDDYTLKSNIDFNLTDCLLDGVEVIVTFQDGGLAGYDLAIIEDSWDNGLKQFKLKQNDQENALKVPGDIHFSVGDKFILTGLKMPQSYRDNASLQLQEEAQAWLDGKCEKRIQLRGKCDEILFRLQNIFIACGQMVGAYSEQLDIDREIRVTKVKRYIEKDGTPSYRCELTLSDFLESNGFKDLVDDVNKVPDKIEERHNNALSFTKRRWRDAVEALSMLEDAISGFSAAINPITIQTMAMLVGDESLQFRFVNSKTNPSEIIPDFKYNQQTKVFTVPAGILQHMTLGVSKLSSSHAASEYKYWDMQAYVSPPLDETDAMYLYSRCSKSGTTGTFILSKTPCKMDSGDGYYYFLTGALSSEYESERSFVTVYGFTEILPGRITVGMIVSPDGQTYFNVAQGEFAGKFVFKSASGYENIADKPDLSVYGTKALLNSIKDNLQNQLDGKIDTYYQSSNPWNNWPAGTEPEHVGDMWYNTSTGILQTYIGPSSNIWREIVDPAAVEAAKAAAKAADVKADGKRRVFLSTPYPPYDAGDQWIEYGGSGSMRICVQGRQSGRYVSSDWQISSADGNTQASIDRGVISAAGFLTFGGSAGVVGSGDIRIWSGGSNAAGATFKVKANGDVESKGNIYIANINNEKLAGFSGAGTTGDSIRIWAGNASPGSAAFRVTQDGTANISKLNATGGKIGRFEIVNNRLVWDQYGYMGGVSRALKMGYSTGYEGVLDVIFDAATEGKFGVKAVGRASGSAAIYGSGKSTQSYPQAGTVWAAWFDGYMFSDGYFTRSPKGNVRGGLKGAYRIDNSDTWFVFDNGIAVACTKPRSVDLDTDKF